MAEQTSNWTVNFKFDNLTWPELDLKNFIEGVTFHTDKVKDGIKISGFEIKVPNTIEINARDIAEGKANIIFNYLTHLHDYPVQGHLTNMVNDRGEGTASYKMSGGVVKSMDVDLADINSIIKEHDERYLRQLSHYARGLAAPDIITKYREFYQVYEDELTKDDKVKPPSTKTIDDDILIKFVRNLLSHPRLTGAESVAAADKEFAGKTSIDLDSSADMEFVKRFLKIVQEKAEKLLQR